MLEAKIIDCCRRLKLSRNLAEMAQNTDGETHQEYLCKLLEAELKNREVGRMAKLVAYSGLFGQYFREYPDNKTGYIRTPCHVL
jgi:hypothetical protein